MKDPSPLIGKPWNGDLHYKQRSPYDKGVVFVDFDGCLSICNWRNALLPQYSDRTGKGKYEDFHRQLPYDPPNEWLITMIRQMHRDGVKVVILTGRRESQRENSVRWLDRYDVPHHWLQMRGENDYRGSEIFKADYISGYYKEEVMMIFDDREKIINHLKSLGYPTFKVDARV